MGIHKVLASFFFLLGAGTNVAEACSCIPGGTKSVEEAYDSADMVFMATAKRIRPNPDRYPNADYKVTLGDITAVWKGNPTDPTRVTTRGSHLCGVTFTVGVEYIVYANSDGSMDGICTGRTGPATEEEAAALDELTGGGGGSECVVLDPPFETDYGDCSTYAKGDESGNFGYCAQDKVDGVKAEDACSECGKCVDPTPGDMCIVSDPDFDAGYGDCSTYADGEGNHDYCRADKAHRHCAECGYTFRTRYGDCSTYAEDDESGNFGYCSQDKDRRTGLLASEACPECGSCTLGEGCFYKGVYYDVGESFKDDCNTCRCSGGGLVACTKKACPPRPTDGCNYKGEYYAAGETFMDDCNTCTCSGNDLVSCTEIACGPSGCDYNGEYYEIGESFMDDCNTCSCQPNGNVICTLIACSPNQVVEWTYDISRGPTYDPLVLNVGDKVTFTWPADKTHDVYKMENKYKFDNCDFSGAVWLGDSSGVEVQGNQQGDYYYACSIGNGNHCEMGGMRIKISFGGGGY